MSGMPTKAYMMVTIFPNEVRVVRFPYPIISARMRYISQDMVLLVPIVVKMVREYMRELLRVQTLTPGSFPV